MINSFAPNNFASWNIYDGTWMLKAASPMCPTLFGTEEKILELGCMPSFKYPQRKESCSEKFYMTLYKLCKFYLYYWIEYYYFDIRPLKNVSHPLKIEKLMRACAFCFCFIFSSSSNWGFWDRNELTFSTYHEKCISIIEADRKIG